MSFATAMTRFAASATKTVRALAPSCSVLSAARERRCGGVRNTATEPYHAAYGSSTPALGLWQSAAARSTHSRYTARSDQYVRMLRTSPPTRERRPAELVPAHPPVRPRRQQLLGHRVFDHVLERHLAGEGRFAGGEGPEQIGERRVRRDHLRDLQRGVGLRAVDDRDLNAHRAALRGVDDRIAFRKLVAERLMEAVHQLLIVAELIGRKRGRGRAPDRDRVEDDLVIRRPVGRGAVIDEQRLFAFGPFLQQLRGRAEERPGLHVSRLSAGDASGEDQDGCDGDAGDAASHVSTPCGAARLRSSREGHAAEDQEHADQHRNRDPLVQHERPGDRRHGRQRIYMADLRFGERACGWWRIRPRRRAQDGRTKHGRKPSQN